MDDLEKKREDPLPRQPFQINIYEDQIEGQKVPKAPESETPTSHKKGKGGGVSNSQDSVANFNNSGFRLNGICFYIRSILQN